VDHNWICKYRYCY